MYDISLDNFQGPMDLLLHLIKKKKMNILDIKLEVIIDEYLEYIRKCENLNLNIASSYLVMSTELLEIKSRMLLPSNNELEPDEIDEVTNLKNRLIEYEKYKNMVSLFKEYEESRREFKTKSPTNILEYKEDKVIHSSLNVDVLKKAYEELLKRIEDDKPTQTKVTKKELSVEDTIVDIRNKFKLNKRMNFLDLFDKYEKSYVVVTFLAILEMSSKKEIKIIQDNNFDNIVCEVVE